MTAAAARVLARRLATVLICASVPLAAHAKPVEREHDVQHLLNEIPDFDNHVSIIDEPIGASRSSSTERPEKTPEQLAREIEQWVTTVVASAGSKPAPRVDLKSKRLRVTLEDADHNRLADVLARDRLRRMTQVTVEARVLGGLELDGTPGFERLRDKLALAMLPGAAGVSLDGDDEVTQLLRITQASRESTVVTAPRVTLFNGQRAYVLVSTQRAYVKDVIHVKQSATRPAATNRAPKVAQAGDAADGESSPAAATTAPAAEGWEPEVGITAGGVLLDVRPAVGPNSNVALAFRLELATLLAMKDAPLPGAPPGTDLWVQVPERDTVKLERTTNVRDGGSRLFYLGAGTDPSRPNRHNFLVLRANVTPPSPAAK